MVFFCCCCFVCVFCFFVVVVVVVLTFSLPWCQRIVKFVLGKSLFGLFFRAKNSSKRISGICALGRASRQIGGHDVQFKTRKYERCV